MIKGTNKPTRDLAPIRIISRNRSTPDPAKNLGLLPRNRSGQEEIVGFAVILIIVAVILLILLSFLLGRGSDKEAVQNYEIQSFLGASLQYTSECEDQIEYLSLQKLINACEEGGNCLDGKDSCEALNETIINLMGKSWNVGSQSSIKGYVLRIIVDGQEKLLFKEGNETNTYKGALQDFAKSGRDYQVSLNIYA